MLSPAPPASSIHSISWEPRRSTELPERSIISLIALDNVTVLQGDTNGDKVADFCIDLSGNITLTTADLLGLIPPTVIESFGSTRLTEITNHFYLYNSSSSGPSLKFGGADFVAGQFSDWTPIGAEPTANGYEVAWYKASTDQYTAWNTDSNGNFISNMFGGNVSGTSNALESIETSFQQDLNGERHDLHHRQRRADQGQHAGAVGHRERRQRRVLRAGL